MSKVLTHKQKQPKRQVVSMRIDALNSDLVGAMNIEARTRAFRHDLEVQGLVVDSPDETISFETSLKPLPSGRGN